ncbi:hypothetical protein CSKR_113491 [Clonorchis sinensis]|uniref:Uncharacterized protein n=1 Tax=Clonorchis sinensis TaxID=79923 RepID=A0A3R7CIC5_CLOSI|nr:hypothetical protein CSKR_113491 [Clonorchis sinensis]
MFRYPGVSVGSFLYLTRCPAKHGRTRGNGRRHYHCPTHDALAVNRNVIWMSNRANLLTKGSVIRAQPKYSNYSYLGFGNPAVSQLPCFFRLARELGTESVFQLNNNRLVAGIDRLYVESRKTDRLRIIPEKGARMLTDKSTKGGRFHVFHDSGSHPFVRQLKWIGLHKLQESVQVYQSKQTMVTNGGAVENCVGTIQLPNNQALVRCVFADRIAQI